MPAEFHGQQSTAIPVDDILGEGFPFLTERVLLLANAGALPRGQILGLKRTAATGVKVSGAGNGVVGAVTLGRLAMPGVYVLTCTAAAQDAGTFKVQAPDGTRLPDLTVASAYSGDHIALTIADGSADWEVGDLVHVTVTAKAVPYNPAATTGEEIARLILADAVSVGSADLVAIAYRTGVFRADKLTGLTAAARVALEARSIFVR